MSPWGMQLSPHAIDFRFVGRTDFVIVLVGRFTLQFQLGLHIDTAAAVMFTGGAGLGWSTI